MTINLERIAVGECNTNCYLVENDKTGRVIIVDPGAEAARIISAVGARTPEAVLLTHGHFDHIGAVDAICARYGVPLYLHALDIDKLGDPDANVSRMFGEEVAVHTPAVALQDGQTLSLAGIDLTVMHTPGHSAGSCCYLLPDGQGVLCGDTLFFGGYGRTDFPDGSFADLRRSLKRLMTLSPRQTAYPGHEGVTLCGRDAAL